MSRLGLVILLSLATLGGCASSPFSAAPVSSATAPLPPQTTAEPSPLTPPPPETTVETTPETNLEATAELSGGVVVTPLGTLPATMPVAPHIALLLPLQSRDFSRAAGMVREGFETAATVQTDKALPLKVYSLDGENEALLAAYREATAAGARCIVAGLTRDAATAIATSGTVAVPTLVLNRVEPAQIPAAVPFYTFSLSLDDEARQVARLIASQGMRRVAVLAGPSALSKRVRDAFQQKWIDQGGEIAARLEIGRDPAQYPKLRVAVQTADAIFIAAEPALIRQVRPYVATGAPTFATSQVYDNRSTPGANVDLQDMHFVDMPWMVEPSHPAVAAYPRNSKLIGADLDRLYALGIDAYRLAYALATKENRGIEPMDGVTGRITLADDGYQLLRELTPAYFDQGQALAGTPTTQ